MSCAARLIISLQSTTEGFYSGAAGADFARWRATALLKARFASGSLPPSYTISGDTTLPEDEAAQLRFEFETEIRRLERPPSPLRGAWGRGV